MFFCCSSSSLQEAPVGTAIVFFDVTLAGVPDVEIIITDQNSKTIRCKIRNGDSITPLFLKIGESYSITAIHFPSEKITIKKPPVFKGAASGSINYAMTLYIIKSGFMKQFKAFSSEIHFEKAKSKFNNRYSDYSKSKGFNRLATENTVEKSKLLDF